jgi:hypothetical protein
MIPEMMQWPPPTKSIMQDAATSAKDAAGLMSPPWITTRQAVCFSVQNIYESTSKLLKLWETPDGGMSP